MTLLKRRIILIFCGLAFLLCAPSILLYSYGYRLDKNWRISKTGGLYVSAPISGAEIFVKNKKEKETNILQSGLFLQNLKSGIYPVIIAEEGFWPWMKNLEIKEGMVAEARAFLIPKNPKGIVLIKGGISNLWASPYDKVLLLRQKNGELVFYLPSSGTFLSNAASPTSYLLSSPAEISNILWEKGGILFESEKGVIRVKFDLHNSSVKAGREQIKNLASNIYEKFSKRKDERLFWDPQKNEIWIEWLGDKNSIPYFLCDNDNCKTSSFFLIAHFSFPVKNADFFPGRRDLIIAAVSNSVFAMEVDGRGGRLSQPIYKGKDPVFAVLPNEKTIYILDDGILSAVELE